MCLAVPMRVLEVRGLTARCEARGVERSASLLLLGETVQAGDLLVIHLGHALAKVTAEHAEAAWALFDEMLAAQPPAD